ncbi:hypothetical protein [uncultured Planktomarina sp.]|uniref:hypothetical protein n=1 Tax=uncultured Planktomarina sp. TaxID=1538529 RepID=UPI003260713C
MKFGNKGNIFLLFADDPALFNQCAYLPVNPERPSMPKGSGMGLRKLVNLTARQKDYQRL